VAKQLKDVLSSTRNLAFNNGTNIDVGPFVGQITQWTNEHSGARLTYRVSADEDTSFALRRAFEELGIQEQETICLDVVSAAPTRGLYQFV